MFIRITPSLSIDASEVTFTFVTSQGPGGQNVNKVATAAELRFDVMSSPSLSEDVRLRLIQLAGKKINADGELVIKASRYRTQARNKDDALGRLKALLKSAATPPKRRKKTRPSQASVERRLTEKKLRGKTKHLRGGKQIEE